MNSEGKDGIDSAEEEVQVLVEHLFRRKAGQMSASSPVYALNKIVALGMVAGPAAALAELELLRNTEALMNYYLLPATLGEMLLRNGQTEKAGNFFNEAFSLATNPAEKYFLQKRIQLCETYPNGCGLEPVFNKNSRRA